MTFTKSMLLASAAGLVAFASAQAADLPVRKASPVEYVKVCEAYGAGFFVVPGTDSCLKIGGRVRVDYDLRGKAGNDTQVGASDQSGMYNRAYIAFDHRTPSAWGTVQTYGRLRLDTGSGTFGGGSSLEAAYIRFAGFTFGQASQPFAFMSSWATQSNYWTGWANGVRQLAYTATFGGGISATVAVTDGTAYGTRAVAPLKWSNGQATFVANVRYDQSWGAFQVMGAYAKLNKLVDTATLPAVTKSTGYAIGMGASFKLPMLARGDEVQFTAVYWNRLPGLGVGTNNLRTPSAGGYGDNPLYLSDENGIPTHNSDGWNVGAQFKHYWTPSVRSQFYAAYASMDLNYTGVTKAKGTAFNVGTGLIWSPVRNFDIGVEVMYLRAKATAPGETAIKDSNIVSRLRVERTF